MNEIRIPQKIWEKMYSHLFDTPGEHFAFFLAEVVKSGNGTIFLVNDVISIDENDTEPEFFGVKIKDDALLHVTNTAVSKKSTLIEIHNHGEGFGYEVGFSGTDVEGFKEFVPYALGVLPNRPYAALVLTKKYLVEGLMWEKLENPESISRIKIIGKNFRKILTSSGKKVLSTSSIEEKIFSRQILAFGKQGQEEIGSVKVAIVGLGGIGSHIAQQLAYLGVQDLVIVDPDLVEETNLNRLVGATKNDVGKPKTEIIARMISNITDNKTNIEIFQNDLRDINVFDALKQVDFIFGCLDNDGPRLILNQLAHAYLIHYIDSATGIHVNHGKIEQAGGQVVVIHPDGPCLESCTNSIDLKEAFDNLTSKQEYDNRKKLGYVSGADIIEPSVISLNGTIASLAVTEFKILVTGLRDAREFIVYDMLESQRPSVVPRHVKVNEKCLHHSFLGIGDKIHLERYINKEGSIFC